MWFKDFIGITQNTHNTQFTNMDKAKQIEIKIYTHSFTRKDKDCLVLFYVSIKIGRQ